MKEDIVFRQISASQLDGYGEVSIAFKVRSILRPERQNGGLGGILLREEAVESTYLKDYDALHTEGPQRWVRRFDTRNWAFLVAEHQDLVVGGATIAYDTPSVNMLAGRRHLAVLWDLRVRPEWRRKGIGRRLFNRAAEWSEHRCCAKLKIETQNVNVAACRFYQAMGCHLGEIDCYAYAGDPRVAHETMLVWYFDLLTGQGQADTPHRSDG